MFKLCHYKLALKLHIVHEHVVANDIALNDRFMCVLGTLTLIQIVIHDMVWVIELYGPTAMSL